MSVSPVTSPESRRTPACRVVVADDHPVCAQLLPLLLEQINCQVVGVANDGEEALRQCEALRPEILLLDLVLPKLSGVEVLQRIRGQKLPIKVILFTGSFSRDVLREAMVVGVEGCLLKTAAIDEIRLAFQRVRDGQLAFGPEAAEMMRQIIVAHDESAALTELETAVLRHTAEGRAVKAVAADLSLSESGVYKVLDRVKRKLGVQTLQELTLSAVRRRLVAV